MFVLLLSFLAAQIILGVIFSCIGMLKVRQRSLTLREEIAAGDTSVQAYQRFATARQRITYPPLKLIKILFYGCIGLAAFTVARSVIFSHTFDPIDIFFSFDVLWLILLFLFILALGIGHIIGKLVFSLVGACVVDAEAVRFFSISHLQRREILTLSLRSALLNTLPIILCLEILALPFLSFPLDAPSTFFLSWNSLPVQLPIALTFMLFLSAFCIVVTVGEVVSAVFGARLHAFTNVLQPITQTPWANLAPRIAAYARLAGVEISSIQVQQDLPGTFSAGYLGLGKPVLFISEFFLRHSEWRQQDAIVSLVISFARKNVNRHMLLSKLASTGAAIACIVLPLGSVAFIQGLNPITSFLLSSIVALTLYSKTSSYFRRLHIRNDLEADCIASYLTGDPVALMVALNVVYTFNGERLDHSSEQARRLDELAHQPWPHAPQASLPVPAVFALDFDSRPLSTSLDQATSPDPVPTAPYQTLPE